MSNTTQNPIPCYAAEQLPNNRPSTLQHPSIMVPDSRAFHPSSLNVMQQHHTIHTQHHLLTSSNPLLHGQPLPKSQMASPNPQSAPIQIQPKPQPAQNHQPLPGNHLIDPQLLAMSHAAVQNHQQPLTQSSQVTGQAAQYQSPLSENQPRKPQAYFTNQRGSPYYEPAPYKIQSTQQIAQHQSPISKNQPIHLQASTANQPGSLNHQPAPNHLPPPQKATQYHSPLPKTHTIHPHPSITHQTPPPTSQQPPILTQSTPTPPKPKPLATYMKPLSSLTPSERRARQSYHDDYDSDRKIYLSFRIIPNNGLTAERQEVLDKVFKHRTLSTMPKSQKGEEQEKRASLEGLGEVALLRVWMGSAGGEMGVGEGVVEGEEDEGDEVVVEIEEGEGKLRERLSEGTTMTYCLNGRAVTKEELDGMIRYPQWRSGAS